MDTSNDYKIWIAVCTAIAVLILSTFGYMSIKSLTRCQCTDVALHKNYTPAQIVEVCGEATP